MNEDFTLNRLETNARTSELLKKRKQKTVSGLDNPIERSQVKAGLYTSPDESPITSLRLEC